nr:uncharacterized protein LOC125627202 [Caretta caretta]
MAAAPALIAAKGLGKFEQSLALLEGRAQRFALRGGSSQGRGPSWQGEGTPRGKLTREGSQLARGGHCWGEAHRGEVPAGKGRAPLGGSSQRRGPSWQGEGTAGGKLTEERSQLAWGGHRWGEAHRGGVPAGKGRAPLGGSSQRRGPSWHGEGTAGGKLTEEGSQLARGGHRWGEAHRGEVPAGKGRAPLGGSSQRRGPSWQGEGTAGGKLTEERSQLARGGHRWGEAHRGGVPAGKGRAPLGGSSQRRGPSWQGEGTAGGKFAGEDPGTAAFSARAPAAPQKLERHLLEPPVSMCTALLRGR